MGHFFPSPLGIVRRYTIPVRCGFKNRWIHHEYTVEPRFQKKLTFFIKIYMLHWIFVGHSIFTHSLITVFLKGNVLGNVFPKDIGAITVFCLNISVKKTNICRHPASTTELVTPTTELGIYFNKRQKSNKIYMRIEPMHLFYYSIYAN